VNSKEKKKKAYLYGKYVSCLSSYLSEHIGDRIIVLTPSFPYIFIGPICSVLDDCLTIDVETTHIEQLENRHWTINLSDIEVFYVEKDGEAQIPNLKS
jgi:hypothetical protein